MRKDLQEKLFNAYPKIFQDRSKSMSETAMCWGITCGDGWYELIDKLCQKLTAIEQEMGYSIIATQVKEKFGTLRFYVRFENMLSHCVWWDIIDDVIDKAEHISAQTCETCGDWGHLTKRGGWLATLCETCAKKEDFKEEKNG